MALARKLWTDESGQDLIEYCLLLLIIGALVALAMVAYQGELSRMFSSAVTVIQSY